jgi:hypothetical protein
MLYKCDALSSNPGPTKNKNYRKDTNGNFIRTNIRLQTKIPMWYPGNEHYQTIKIKK